jgi:hypothetical protein
MARLYNVTEASPKCKTDQKDESEIAIGSGGRRRRQWRGACEQGKRLGIEYRRAGTLDDPAIQHVALSIDTEAEINDARRALGVRRIALEARKPSYEGLLPVGNHRSQLRRRGDCGSRERLLELRLSLRGLLLGGLLLGGLPLGGLPLGGPLLCVRSRARSDQRCGPSQSHHEVVQAPGEAVNVEIQWIVVAVGDLRVDRGMERGNKPSFGAYAGDNINLREPIIRALVKAGSGVRASLRCPGTLPRG